MSLIIIPNSIKAYARQSESYILNRENRENGNSLFVMSHIGYYEIITSNLDILYTIESYYEIISIFYNLVNSNNE